MTQAHVSLTSHRPFRSYLSLLWDYWVHGLFLSVAFVFVGATIVSYSVMSLDPTWVLGFLVSVVISLIISPLWNAHLCSWVWHFDVSKYWMRLLAQGAVLTAVYLAEVVIFDLTPIGLLVFSWSPLSPFSFLSVLLMLFHFAEVVVCGIMLGVISGFIGKSVGLRFKEKS